MWALSTIAAMLVGLLTLQQPVGAHAAAGQRIIVQEGQSIQAAIDAAAPGSKIVVRGTHAENVWINKGGIELVGRNATLTAPEQSTATTCAPPDATAPLICVAPTDAPPPGQPLLSSEDRLDGVTIRGFTFDGSPADALAVLFANRVNISRNTFTDSGCNGVFAIFTDDLKVRRNRVADAGCEGIEVLASSNLRVSRNRVDGSQFAGVAVRDTENTVVSRNIASDNCLGISVINGNDLGYGIPGDPDFPGDNLRIVGNRTNGNSKTCPFGPTFVGLSGIVAGGMTDLTIRNNTANDNAGDEMSITAGGISVGDFPNPDGSLSGTSGVRVVGNQAIGNFSAAGATDLNLMISGTTERIARNSCGVSVPDPTWCDG